MRLNPFKWFKKEIEEEIEEEEVDYDEIASINISIQKDMSLEIACWWIDPTEEPQIAYAFGTALKCLTTGAYDFLLAQALAKSFDDKDANAEKFVIEVLSIWNDKDIGGPQQKDLPVVGPLKTFGESNFGGPG